MKKSIIFLILLFSLVSCYSGEDIQPQQSQHIQEAEQPQSTQQLQDAEIAGELFGVPVPMSNFYFSMRVAATFGTPWGAIPRTPEKLQERTWDDLLLSFEAFRRNITVGDEELEAEISKSLEGYKVEFDWKQDKEAYEEWVQTTLNEPAELFENQMKHLVQLKKLQQEILDSIEPIITEEEISQDFPERNESYYDQLKLKKRYEGFYEWLGNLKEQADIKIYAKPPEGLFKESNP